MAFALLLAIYYTKVSSPGIFFTDTIHRWSGYIDVILSGSDAPQMLNATPSLFMLASYRLTGSYAAFTFLQCFGYFFSSFCVLQVLARRYWLLATLLFVNPVTIGYSVFGDMGVLCLVGINSGFLLCRLLYRRQGLSGLQVGLVALALAAAGFLVLGYRQNAFTVLPVLVAYALVRFHRDKQPNKLLAALLGPVLGAACAFIVPFILNVNMLNTATPGFTWDILNAIEAMPPEKQAEYSTYLDDITGTGSTQQALESNRGSTTVNPWLWSDLHYEIIGTQENSRLILEKYGKLLINEPRYFLAGKMRLVGQELGLVSPLQNAEYVYKVNADMDNLGFRESARRLAFVENVNKTLDTLVVYRLPWVWFLLGGLACLYQRLRRRPTGAPLALLALAVFYYGAFLLNSQSLEFRYFFPAFSLLYCLCAMWAAQLLADVVDYVKSRRKGRKTA